MERSGLKSPTDGRRFALAIRSNPKKFTTFSRVLVCLVGDYLAITNSCIEEVIWLSPIIIMPPKMIN